MGQQIDGFTVKSHFKDKEPAVRHTYDRLLKATGKFGPFIEEPKKTSIHLSTRQRSLESPRARARSS